ncbi:MAG: acyclic terpene utilization AtuA family protein [Lachnospiraceae bacterium]|nr:acyclic terpene utilization AtuA family protein [Lachnospiraceae bacterium]
MKPVFKILSPSGILGYGFPESSFRAGVELKPDLIACDAGSTDPGPYYLGSGIPFTNASAVKRDLTLMLKAACELGIPMVIGSGGGCGAKPHVARELESIREIAEEHKLSFKMAVIYSDFDNEYVLEELDKGHLKPLGAAPMPTREDILASTHIVGQMGVAPIIAALDQGAQVVFCGRCYDPASFSAPAIRLGYDAGLAVHLGKILECAAIAATPGSASDCMMGYLGEDFFEVEPLSPDRKCTPLSVSAHTLYEKSDPCHLPGPGGMLDLSGCTFTVVNERRVRVTGSKLIPAPTTIKLEGAKSAGFRTISVCGNRDPIFISQVDNILENVKRRTRENLSADFDYQLNFIVYGKNGVMGDRDPGGPEPYEIGIVIDAVADTEERSASVCAVARSTMLHYGYPGRIATAGNLAFPFSPSDIHVGEIYTFSVYCLMDDPEPLRRHEVEWITYKEGQKS